MNRNVVCMSRYALLAIIMVAVVILLPACGSGASEAQSPAAKSTSVASPVHDNGEQQDAGTSSPQATGELQVVLVPSELVVGLNRFAVGLFGPDGAMIDSGVVEFRYFDLTDPQTPVPETAATAVRIQSPDGLTAIFAHEREFRRAGSWGVEVRVQLPEGTSYSKGIRFEVQAGSRSVLPGEPAPRSESPTLADVDNDVTRLTSASEPNSAFYERSIAEAVASGRPTLILFATPSFCETRFCGPGYDIVSTIEQRYGPEMNFVHVEVYSGLPNPAANNWARAAAMEEFGLQTEPWLYLVDRTGTVVYRVEGMFTQQEIEQQLDRLGVAALR